MLPRAPRQPSGLLSSGATPTLPTAWPLLEQALRHRRPVAASYHGHQRVLCPHALGFHHGMPAVLAYQAGGTTSGGPLPPDSRKRWRWLYVNDLHDLRLTDDPWQTADNYTPTHHRFDQVTIAIHADHDGHQPPVKV